MSEATAVEAPVSRLVTALVAKEQREYAGRPVTFARALGLERHKWAAIRAGAEIRDVRILRQILAAVPEVLPEVLDYVRLAK